MTMNKIGNYYYPDSGGVAEIKLFNCDYKNVELPDEKLIVVTDPPFNVGYHYNGFIDNMDEDEYYNGLSELVKRNKSVIVHYAEDLHKLSIRSGLSPEKIVSWVYNSNTQKQHRDIAFYGVKPDFNAVKQPYKNPNDKRIAERIKNGKVGGKLYDWWNVNQVKNVNKEKTMHPCQMPLSVMLNIIGVLPEEYTIFDPFMGSGTTGVACKLLGRNFIGSEIVEDYYNIAKGRIEGA